TLVEDRWTELGKRLADGLILSTCQLDECKRVFRLCLRNRRQRRACQRYDRAELAADEIVAHGGVRAIVDLSGNPQSLHYRGHVSAAGPRARTDANSFALKLRQTRNVRSAQRNGLKRRVVHRK